MANLSWYIDPPHSSGWFWALGPDDSGNLQAYLIEIRLRDLTSHQAAEIEEPNAHAWWEYFHPGWNEWFSLEFHDDFFLAWCHATQPGPPHMPADLNLLRPSSRAHHGALDSLATTNNAQE